jgi:hypothetical protein
MSFAHSRIGRARDLLPFRRVHRREYVLELPDGTIATLSIAFMPRAFWSAGPYAGALSPWRVWKVGGFVIAVRFDC